MNSERRRTHDIKLLSTYLDDALNPRQKRRLEARLSKELALREKLEQLRMTKEMVGRLSRVRAPRNFTLTPEMVRIRKPKKQPFFTVMRMATSLAAILLVVLFGVELFLGGGFLAKTQSAEPVMEAARLADEATPEPLIIWSQPGMGGGAGASDAAGVGGAEGEPNLLEAPMTEEQAVPEAEMPEEPLLEESMPMEQPEIQSKMADEGQSPILGINTDAGGDIIDRSQPDLEQTAPSGWPSLTIHWIQLGLAVIAVGGAFILLILSTRRKHSS